MLEFQVADPDVMRQRLIDAGLGTSSSIRSTRSASPYGPDSSWDWTIGGNPIPSMLVADLTNQQREDIIQVLDGMIRERFDGSGSAVLTAPLNIGVGTK